MHDQGNRHYGTHRSSCWVETNGCSFLQNSDHKATLYDSTLKAKLFLESTIINGTVITGTSKLITTKSANNHVFDLLNIWKELHMLEENDNMIPAFKK